MSPATNTFTTKKFLIRGMVQGVGFRPHLYRLASENSLRGQVANSLAGVELVLEGNQAKISLVIDTLLASPPPGSFITSVNEQTISPRNYCTFTIAQSHRTGDQAPLAPADFAMCSTCEKELGDSENHRFQHPFISCTACGPRFSLIKALPYDRPLTAMAEFPLCPICHDEYINPASRRFHAEPICCPDCGPRLKLYCKNEIAQKNPLMKAAALLKEGRLLGIKGVGGFHLAVDACNDRAVSLLRSIKKRADKPLAIMVRDLGQAADLAHIRGQAEELLSSPMRPIVIMPTKSKSSLSSLIAPGIAEIGIMLAYTPLHHLLFNHGPKALVMTSFNEPGNPMLTSTTEALARLGTACDAVLSHNRQIINRCDDSVYRMHRDKGQLLRRSRGYAPLPVPLPTHSAPILACGAGEKLTICLTRKKMAFLSQHLGECRSPEGQRSYLKAARHLQDLLHIKPAIIAHDLHPGYFSSRFAMDSPQPDKIAVQHHHAHIASCMAENGIDRPVIGLALDGTGLGTDGTLWGGEILLCTLSDSKRLAHLAPLAMPGAEAAIKEPWRLALAWLHREGRAQSDLAFLREIPNNTKEMLIEMINRKVNSPLTSSLGRLFDAAAALINLRGKITFSAQAAMELEAIAEPEDAGFYTFEVTADRKTSPYVMETSGLLEGIINDLDKGVTVARIAGRFHNTIIRLLTSACTTVAAEQGINEVVCSGGVLQNRIINMGLQDSLAKAGFTVHCHHKVPCNDGGVALGQAAVAAAIHEAGHSSARLESPDA